VGEVVAALLYIHEMGFSYNDLKPENLLVTALGHIKVVIRYLSFNLPNSYF